jgi:hypothetical protein
LILRQQLKVLKIFQKNLTKDIENKKIIHMDYFLFESNNNLLNEDHIGADITNELIVKKANVISGD